MKPLLEGRTPTQLLWIIAASNALISLGFGMPFFVPSWQHHRLSFSQAICWFAAVVVGFISDMLSEAALKEGVASERWPEALLAAPRKLLEHPAISVLGWSLIVASFAVLAFARVHNYSSEWVFLAPALSLTRIRTLMRPPSNIATHTGLRHPLKPLQSEHWGTPPQSFSN